VRRPLAENIVDFLSFSDSVCDRLDELRRSSQREWGRTLRWLDDAGLAFYFLQKLKNASATNIVPGWVLSRLEENLKANRQRVNRMWLQFALLNQKFNDAGVRFAVVKGFSLVPRFCPNASLRHQSDFDYLVEEQSLPRGKCVLDDAGYSLKEHRAQEYSFIMPSARTPVVAGEQYEAHAPHAVELHLALWDKERWGVPLAFPRFSADHTRTHSWQGLTFPVLHEEDAFLLQVIHVFKHILDYWVRLSWVYEIGYFLDRHASDVQLWGHVEDRVAGNPFLREFVVVVTELVARIFGAPVPPLVASWSEEVRPGARVWVESYARKWVFGKNRVDELTPLPTAKLVLFLHQQYVPDRRRLIWNRLFPSTRLSRIAHSVAGKPSIILQNRWRQRERVFRRFLFHLAAGLRYLWEVPRWRWLNRRDTHPAQHERRHSITTDLEQVRD